MEALHDSRMFHLMYIWIILVYWAGSVFRIYSVYIYSRISLHMRKSWHLKKKAFIISYVHCIILYIMCHFRIYFHILHYLIILYKKCNCFTSWLFFYDIYQLFDISNDQIVFYVRFIFHVYHIVFEIFETIHFVYQVFKVYLDVYYICVTWRFNFTPTFQIFFCVWLEKLL